MDDTSAPTCPACGADRGEHAPGCTEAADPSAPAAPWSIPIRDAGPDVPHGYATWVDQTPISRLLVGAVAVLVFAAVVVFAVAVAEDSDPPPDVAGDQITKDAPAGTTPSTESLADTAATTSSTTTSAPAHNTDEDEGSGETDPDEDRGSEPAETTAPATDTTVAPEPTDLPILDPAVLEDGWVTQLSSVPSASGGNALRTAFETVQRDMPDAVIVRGSEWPALRGGFWVIVHTGFDSGGNAADACVAAGLTDRDDCFGRFLSAGDSAERVCHRDPDGTLAGDCT